MLLLFKVFLKDNATKIIVKIFDYSHFMMPMNKKEAIA